MDMLNALHVSDTKYMHLANTCHRKESLGESHHRNVHVLVLLLQAHNIGRVALCIHTREGDNTQRRSTGCVALCRQKEATAAR
jgi:hypothetical protein